MAYRSMSPGAVCLRSKSRVEWLNYCLVSPSEPRYEKHRPLPDVSGEKGGPFPCLEPARATDLLLYAVPRLTTFDPATLAALG